MPLLASRGGEKFYLDKTWTDSIWPESSAGQQMKLVTLNRLQCRKLAVTHVGSQHSFVMTAQLIYKTGAVDDDYHSQMTTSNERKIIWNVQGKSVVKLWKHTIPLCAGYQRSKYKPNEGRDYFVAWEMGDQEWLLWGNYSTLSVQAIGVD